MQSPSSREVLARSAELLHHRELVHLFLLVLVQHGPAHGRGRFHLGRGARYARASTVFL